MPPPQAGDTPRDVGPSRAARAAMQTEAFGSMVGLAGADFLRNLPPPSTFEAARAKSLAAGVSAATIVGCVYAFNILSDPMKHQFDLDQKDIDLIATIAFMLAQFNIPAGWLHDRFGVRAVNAVTFTSITVGMTLLGLIFAGAIRGTTATLTVAYSLAAWTSGWVDIGTVMPNLYLFPLNRGDVVIVQKTFMGLGTAVFATVFGALFSDTHIAGYCFCCAGAAVLAGLLSVSFVHSGQEVERRGGLAFNANGEPSPVTAADESAGLADDDDGGKDEQGPDDARPSMGAMTRATASQQPSSVGLGGMAMNDHRHHHSNGGGGSSSSSDAEAVIAARAAAFRQGTTRAPRQMFWLGFILLAITFGYLALCEVAGGTGQLKQWPLGTRVVVAVGALGLVACFWFLVPVAVWHATPVAPRSAPQSTTRSLPPIDPEALTDDGATLDGHAVHRPPPSPGQHPRQPPPTGTAALAGEPSFDGFAAVATAADGGPAERSVMQSALIAAESGHTTPRSARGGAGGTPRGGQQPATLPSPRSLLPPSGAHPPNQVPPGVDAMSTSQRQSDAEPLLPGDGALGDDEAAALTPPFPFERVLDALTSPPFLLVYFVLLFQLGAGTTIATNGAQIYKAKNDGHFESSTNTAFQSLVGVGSAAGRVIAGLLDRFFPHIPTTAYVVIPSVLNVIAMLLFIVVPVDGLYAAYLIYAIAYGAAWAFAIMTARLVFPARIVGTVYACLFTAGIIASVVFNLALFGPHYDSVGRSQGRGGSKGCVGTACYSPTLIVVACGNALGIFAAVAFHWLWLRHRRTTRADSTDQTSDAL